MKPRHKWQENDSHLKFMFSVMKHLRDTYQRKDPTKSYYNKRCQDCADVMNIVFEENKFTEGMIFGQEYLPEDIDKINEGVLKKLNFGIDTGYYTPEMIKEWIKKTKGD